MDNIVNFIGEGRVVQIVTDNGANYKAAGQLLMGKRKRLYWIPCATHCIDLILEDISKETEVQTVITNCQLLTGFIYNHGWLLSIMRKETKDSELIRPAVTRFATHFIALESIHKHKDDLRRMITSREWNAKMPNLGSKDRKTANLVYNLIHSDNFWSEAASIILVFEPLVKVLRMVDNDDKAEMGYLYEAMDRAKESIKKNVGGRQYKKWWTIIDKRWERQLHRPIHAAGYFLNPHIQYGNNATNDNEVLNGWASVLDRMVPDISTQIEIAKEVEMYKMKAGVFGSAKAKQAVKSCLPAMWWSIIGREVAPNLTRLAMRILSQTVSSSNCERNWTTFAMIHTKLRNRIKMDNLQKLVFVHYNMRLRIRHAKRQKTTDQLIDLDYIFHEEDPLAEWTKEVEDRLLDDRDNPWLDEAIINANDDDDDVPVQRTKLLSTLGKEPTTYQNSENSSSSNDNSGNTGGEGAGFYDYGAGSNVGRSFQRPTNTYSRSGVDDYHERRDKQLNVGHGYQRNYDNTYAPNDVPSYRYSTSDLPGGYSYHEANQANSSENSNNQDEPSPYDNMMVTFLGPEQMQYGYPTYYNRTDYEDNDEYNSYGAHQTEDNNKYDAQRNSFWY